jgi:hypothetical protein
VQICGVSLAVIKRSRRTVPHLEMVTRNVAQSQAEKSHHTLGLSILRVTLKAHAPSLLAQPPKIISKDLTPGLQCIFRVPSSLIVLSLFDTATSLSQRVEIALFDSFRPFARYIISWIDCIQDNHQIVRFTRFSGTPQPSD